MRADPADRRGRLYRTEPDYLSGYLILQRHLSYADDLTRENTRTSRESR